MSYSRINVTEILQLSCNPVYTKNLGFRKALDSLAVDEPVQVHMRGTNPKKLPTVTRIVSRIFAAIIHNMPYFLKLVN